MHLPAAGEAVTPTAFRIAGVGQGAARIGIFYRIDATFGYALKGSMPVTGGRERLLAVAVAEQMYGSLDCWWPSAQL